MIRVGSHPQIEGAAPMIAVPVSELRRNTAAVLRRVQSGEAITITVRGEPVAEIVPITDPKGRQQDTEARRSARPRP